MIKKDGSGDRGSRVTRPGRVEDPAPLKASILICLSIVAIPRPPGHFGDGGSMSLAGERLALTRFFFESLRPRF